MATNTLYHATDAAKKDSIQVEGLRAGMKNLVFLTTTAEEAEYIGDIYDTIDDTVIFEVEVMEHNLREDPEPHGDLDSYAHHGDIPAHDVEVVRE
jgi:RNA:NAD 2'-phosphotransferase (TPT1/KptA family)